MERPPETLLIARPAGFCAGVVRAIEIAEAWAGEGPVIGLHQLIHNKPVTDSLSNQGITFVDEVAHIPRGSRALISAHGASPETWKQLRVQGVQVKDATCPLVAKPHEEVRRAVRDSLAAGKVPAIVYACHLPHREAEGVIGEAPDYVHPVETVADVANLKILTGQPTFFFTQTTLSQDDMADVRAAVRKRFPEVQEPKKEDICFATQHRQDGAKAMVRRGAEGVLIVGSPNSSNTLRLEEVVLAMGARAQRFEKVADLDEGWLDGLRTVGLTGGASASPVEIQKVVEHLVVLGVKNFKYVMVADERKMRFNPNVSLHDFRERS